jgi:hypothetical protein
MAAAIGLAIGGGWGLAGTLVSGPEALPHGPLPS